MTDYLCSTDHFYAAQSHFHAAEVALIGHRNIVIKSKMKWPIMCRTKYKSTVENTRVRRPFEKIFIKCFVLAVKRIFRVLIYVNN